MAASKFPTLSLSSSLARFLCRLSASTHHRHTHHSDRLPSVVYQSCVLGGTAGTADRCRTRMPTADTSWHEDHRQPNASATGPAAGVRVLGKNTRIVVLFRLCNCSQLPVYRWWSPLPHKHPCAVCPWCGTNSDGNEGEGNWG